MNPVLILTHNCLELTKKCVASIRAQDIPTQLIIFDNGSTDGTADFASISFPDNPGVSFGWNFALRRIFTDMACDYCLVLNNDTEIPSFFYSKLLSYNLSFVTGISVDEIKDHPDSWTQPAESPDFSAFLIRRDCWNAIGPFDESMIHYCSDCDYHIRAHRLGIPLMNAGVPFHHSRSSTLRHATPFDRAAIERQANVDRETFRAKYGFYPWEPAYADFFKSEPSHAS